MTEEYLLAWNDHHATFFSAMSDLVTGDVLTDVGIWAGQTLYSAHKLVLALSSSYFRLILTGAGAADNRLPVIFLKDVSSKDFERLLWYMYKGEVSVPQSELLSLISAAKSLGIRGLAEDGPEAGETSEASTEAGERLASLRREVRGLKREQEPGAGTETGAEVSVKRSRGAQSVYPKLQHKLATKPWSQQDPLSSRPAPEPRPALVRPSSNEFTALRPHNDNIISRDQARSPGKERRREAGDEKKEAGDKEQGEDRRQEVGGFLEVTVKQEQEEEPGQEEGVTESPDEFISPPPLSLVRRSLLPTLMPNTRAGLGERRSGGSSALLGHSSSPSPGPPGVTRSTGTCHFCGRSFMKNKQLMNHVCPMRPPNGK